MSKVGPLDLISSGTRRRWTLEEKQRIVAESYAGPRLVSAIARRNGLSASQLLRGGARPGMGASLQRDEVMKFASVVLGDDDSRSQPSLPECEAAGRNLSPHACPTVAPGPD
jgi:transposase